MIQQENATTHDECVGYGQLTTNLLLTTDDQIVGAFFQELFHAGIYKRNQGRLARQLTGVAVALVIGIGAWCLSEWTAARTNSQVMQFGVPLALALVGLWSAFRLVNIPTFADFLISVEAEMNKVSWPARSELFRASIVVLCVIFVLAFVLFMYDLFWRESLQLLNVIERKQT